MKTINDFYDNAEFKDVTNSEVRNLVLTKSLAVENYMAMYLAAIMDIENYLETKSFGNTSAALSFNQKLQLFTDLNYLNKGEKIKFLRFSEIRNQFAHNAACLNFSDAFTKDILNGLKKFYPILNSEVVTEIICRESFDLLYQDIITIFERLKIDIYNNKINDFLLESMSLVLNKTIINIRENPKHFNLTILDEILKKVTALVSDKHNLDKATFRTNIKLSIGKYLR